MFMNFLFASVSILGLSNRK